MPYKELPFLTRRSADVLICPPVLDNVHFLTSFCSLFLPSSASLLRNANVYGKHPRTHAVEPHGVISMECSGRLGSKKSGRVSSCVCVHPRVLSSSVAYPRTPLPSFAGYSRLPRIARGACFYAFEICKVLLPRLRAIRLVTRNNCKSVIKKNKDSRKITKSEIKK